ncbi:unnamed protein product [Lepeophtheirus salmonis]|uniref:(salmon louse) hypothetical protein n=1 Tax=Lepeophtheirus salmonis TaxID=72036 RepID=A0A7R8CBU8_LEPSM|nr:unnamed protein product [Lepeophtheirus salmonis]CAF2764590.1 unnamed protein product [Lepeophtheirus salmonis]
MNVVDSEKVAQIFNALKSSLQCGICYSHLINPTTITDCGHTFCSLCIKGIIGANKNSRCPYCSEGTFSRRKGTFLDSKVSELLRYVERLNCPKESEGKKVTTSKTDGFLIQGPKLGVTKKTASRKRRGRATFSLESNTEDDEDVNIASPKDDSTPTDKTFSKTSAQNHETSDIEDGQSTQEMVQKLMKLKEQAALLHQKIETHLKHYPRRRKRPPLDIHPQLVRNLRKFCEIYEGQATFLSGDFDESINILILSTVNDEDLRCNRTVKYLFALASGSLQNPVSYIVKDFSGFNGPQRSFQRNENTPPLFSQFEFGLIGEFDSDFDEEKTCQIDSTGGRTDCTKHE